MLSVFVRKRLTIHENISFTDYSFGIRLPDFSVANWKNGNVVTIFRHDFIVKFFWCCFVSFAKIKFKSFLSFMSVPSLVSSLWLGPVRNIKFGMSVSNKMLLNAAKCQGYSFYCFWVIKGKPTGGGDSPLPPPRLKLKI